MRKCVKNIPIWLMLSLLMCCWYAWLHGMKTLLELPILSEGNPSVHGFSSKWTRNAELWFFWINCWLNSRVAGSLTWRLCDVTPIPHYRPFVREPPNIFYSQRTSDAELRCCLWCQPKQVVEQTVECHWFETPWCSKDITIMGGLTLGTHYDSPPKKFKCIWSNHAGVNWSTQR